MQATTSAAAAAAMAQDAQSARVAPAKRMRPEAEMFAGMWSSKQQRLDREHGHNTSSSTNDNNNGNNNGNTSTSNSSASVFTGGEAEDAAGLPLTSSKNTGAATAADDSNGDVPHSVTSTLLQSVALSSSSYFSWRLPHTQPLAASEQYLNEQLVHVAGSAALEMRATARRNGLSAHEQEASRQEEDAICTLSLVQRVWGVITNQTAYTPAGKDKLQREQREAEASLRSAMDLISLLLYLRSQELTRETELSERLDAAEKELARRTHQAQTLALELEASRQQLAQQEHQIRAKELAFASERRTLQTEKKSLDVLVAQLQGVETAFKAQLRRKDAEYERLRKNLQDSVARSSKEQRGIAVGKPLNGAAERKRSAQQTQSHESHMTRQLVDALERRKTELLRENDALVGSYAALQRQLELLTSQYRKAAHLFLAKRGPEGQSQELLELTSVAIDDFAPTAFAMPSKQQLPTFLAQAMDALQYKLGQFAVAMRADLEQDACADRDDAIRALQHKLAAAHELIVEQDQLLQASLLNEPVGAVLTRADPSSRGSSSGGGGASAARARDFEAVQLEDRAEELARQKRELEQQQRHMTQERELLREQAMRLDQDRLAFEAEKQELVLGADRARAAWVADSDVAMADVRTSPRHPKRPAASTRHSVHIDSDVHMDSPLRVPVPASPATAALLEKMGILPYDGGFSGS